METTLNLLLRGELNVYELLENFIANLMSTNPNLAPTSIRLYVAAVRSYLAYYDRYYTFQVQKKGTNA